MTASDRSPGKRKYNGGAPHTACPTGKRVYVKLRDGREFVDRFRERTKSYVLVFEREGRIPAGQVAQFITSPAIIRAKTGELG